MRTLDAVQGRTAAVGATANALTATGTARLRSAGDCLTPPGTAAGSSALYKVLLRSSGSSRLRHLGRSHLLKAVSSRAMWSMGSRRAPGCIPAPVPDFTHRLLEPVRQTGRNLRLSQ